jgi:myo-inositol-1(or 4)-monophosphatase
MTYTNDFFIQAQGVIERVFRARRQELIDASGNIAIEHKADKTVVTELDRSVETDLRKALLEFDASIGIEGEEHGIEGNRTTFWLLDPIDGTDSFTRGIPHFRNMATLVDNGEVVFTVVYKPVSDELYVAAKGEGAFRNGVQLNIGDRPLHNAKLEVHSPGNDHRTWITLEKLAQQVKGLSISADFVQVAEGRLDGLIVITDRGGPWDFAPRALLIAEAGAKIANIGSDTYNYTNGQFIATNPVIFDDVMQIIVDSQR